MEEVKGTQSRVRNRKLLSGNFLNRFGCGGNLHTIKINDTV